jgi:hypothetical protein
MIISFPYNTQYVFYTDDRMFTNIVTSDENYIRVLMTIKAYPYQGWSTPITYSQEYEFVSYQGRISIDFGKIVKPYFYIPSDLTEILNFSELEEGVNTIPLYRPLSTDITFQERNRLSNTLLSEQKFSNVRFVRGCLSGELLNPDNESHNSRITSQHLFSYNLYEDTATIWKLSKNGTYIQDLISNKAYVTSYLAKYSDLKPGDIFSLDFNGEKKDSLLTFPKGLQSVFIIWLDQHLALRIFECTGRFIDKQTHSYITNTSIIKGNSITRTIEDIKGREITLNTGYIYKDDIRIIHSVLSSEKAWISFDLKNFISFIPITKELKYTSEDQLFCCDIEISLNNYVEIHSDYGGLKEFNDEFSNEFN